MLHCISLKPTCELICGLIIKAEYRANIWLLSVLRRCYCDLLLIVAPIVYVFVCVCVCRGCYFVLSVLCSFAFISLMKIGLAALLQFSCCCHDC